MCNDRIVYIITSAGGGIDGIIKDALMGTIGTLFGTCTGNSHSTNHMDGFIGMVVNEKLRRIYADLSLSLLPTYSNEVEEAMKS